MTTNPHGCSADLAAGDRALAHKQYSHTPHKPSQRTLRTTHSTTTYSINYCFLLHCYKYMYLYIQVQCMISLNPLQVNLSLFSLVKLTLYNEYYTWRNRRFYILFISEYLKMIHRTPSYDTWVAPGKLLMNDFDLYKSPETTTMIITDC